MVIATDIDTFALALAVVADRALALVVIFAVTAWVLVLSNSHRLLAQRLFHSLFNLRGLIV